MCEAIVRCKGVNKQTIQYKLNPNLVTGIFLVNVLDSEGARSITVSLAIFRQLSTPEVDYTSYAAQKAGPNPPAFEAIIIKKSEGVIALEIRLAEEDRESLVNVSSSNCICI